MTPQLSVWGAHPGKTFRQILLGESSMMLEWDFSMPISRYRAEQGRVCLHICSPLFFLSHTDRPSLWWLNFIIDKKQYVGKNSNSEFLSPWVGLVLCGWYSVHSLDSGRDCSPLRTHHNEERKGQCGVPCCVLVSAGISNTLLTADIFDSHEVYLEATPSLVKDTCITQRTKFWWCDKKSRRGHGSGDRRPRMKTGNDAFQKSSQATPCSCLN